MGISSRQVRERALQAYARGKGTQADIVDLYGVHQRTFRRWWRDYQASGRIEPRPRGHRRPALSDEEMRQLEELLRQTPDLTLMEMRTVLGQTCSLMAMHNATVRLGGRYKRNRSAPASKTAPR